MVQRKQVTARRCGKCKTTFPVGRGHDARTCGNTVNQRDKLHQLKPVTPPRTTKLKKRSTLKEISAKNVPVLLKKPIPAGLLKTMTWKFDNEKKGRVIKLADEKGRYISPPFLGPYNCLETDDFTAWFNEEGQLHRVGGPALVYKNNPTKIWYKNGKVHRDGDEPAYIYSESGDTSLTFEWYQEGNLHRQGSRPAVLRANGTKEWWVDGKQHRLDGPAVEFTSGSKEWWVNNKLHRLDGPAIEYASGGEEWWVNNKLHRLDGPAIEYASGGKEWWVEGKCHRLDGPAKIWSGDGSEWWVNNLLMEEHADYSDIPEIMGDYFYLLCTNPNPIIRVKALANPNCPPAYKIAGKLIRS